MSHDNKVERLELVDKVFGHVDDILWFNRHGMGPFVASVGVRANVHPATSYPDARISLGQWGTEPKEMDFGGILLTVEKATEMVKLLKAAIAEVTKACPTAAMPVAIVEDLS